VHRADESPIAPGPFRAAVAGGLARRRFLGMGAAALGLAVTGCAAPSPRHPRRLRLMLRPPSGPYHVGTVSLHLVDHSRRDPWLPAARPRELMVSVWYPAKDDHHHPWAPWMPPKAGALFLTQLIPSPLTGPSTAPPAPRVSLDGVWLPLTRARQGAPADLSGRRYPVVLYSPGYGDDRALGTGLVSDLASRGYIMVTTDYTYEAAEVQFPGGRVETGRQPNLREAVKVRIADTRFVLDELAVLNSGISPDAGHRPLPAGLAGALDLARTGMFGHSLGGATAAEAMAADRRILAGIDLDGTIIVSGLPAPGDQASLTLVKHLAAAVAKNIGDRPFMIMTHAGHDPRDDVTLEGFWANLKGWRLLLTLTDSGHYSYTDDEEFLSQLVQARIIPPTLASQVVTPVIGTIDPARAVAAERAYISAFLDLHLRRRASSLLDRPSPQYPDIRFLAA
jgi:Platelet-activating factor acetylhydrolase, isoform II